MPRPRPRSRILLWANLRRGANLAVPAPFDDNSSPYWWYDKIAGLANSWAANGVTDVLFPNPVKTQSGPYRTGDGYGPYDHYDIGSKNQNGGVETRFGTAESLRRAIAIFQANGITVHLDIVMHQLSGGQNGVYRYPGADGKTKNGRFPKDPPCFRGASPRVGEDPDIPDVPDDFSFGDEVEVIRSTPKGYMWTNLIAWGDWLFRTTGAGGARLDDMKGMSLSFIKAWMNSGAMESKFFFGEYASGNPDDLNWYIGQTEGRMSLLDFGFHYNRAMPMCNDAGGAGFTMKSLGNRNNALLGTNPMRAIPFVESMDSDTNGFATIVSNKILAYALMLAGEGLPMVYVRDYLQEPDCYGLKRFIDNLMWCNQNLANGPTVTRHSEDKVFVFERTGSPGMLCALSNDVWNPAWHTVTVQTNFGPHVQLHDYSGHDGQDCWTDANGKATIGIPPGANGFGYGMWSRAGLSKPIQTESHSCTQQFFGAADLDIPQAMNGGQTVGRIWVATGSPLTADVSVDKAGWTAGSKVAFAIVDANGKTQASGSNITEASGTADITGWHTIALTSSDLPAAGSDFTLGVNYTATKTLAKEQF